jgi:hypothetical protein
LLFKFIAQGRIHVMRFFEWLENLWFIHILDDFVVKIKFNLSIFFIDIFLQNGLVFQHFEWERVESFMELGRLCKIGFLDECFCLLELVIAEKCEIVINYINNFREMGLVWLVWLVDMRRVLFPLSNLLDEFNELLSKIYLSFILPRASLFCELGIIVKVFIFEKNKIFLIFII